VVTVGLVILGSLGWAYRNLTWPRTPAAKLALSRAMVSANGPITTALRAFEYDMGRHPTPQEGLVALFRSPANNANKWRGPYLEMKWEQLVDPWENQFEYRCPGIHNPDSYDLWSKGIDGISEPENPLSDDIRNW